MPIEDVYSIPGRGTVATGRIERGTCLKGQDIEIVGFGPTVKTTLTGIEMFHKGKFISLISLLLSSLTVSVTVSIFFFFRNCNEHHSIDSTLTSDWNELPFFSLKNWTVVRLEIIRDFCSVDLNGSKFVEVKSLPFQVPLLHTKNLIHKSIF